MAEFSEQEFAPKHHAQQAPETADAAEHALDLASTLGNANVGQVLHAPGVQRAGATGAQQLDESVARAIEERRGLGRPLDDDTRADMEASLGHDLGDVRVHTDGAAHELNQAVSARAFTTGSDVFFTQGTYDPSTSSGRELLGHELTHVVQQREGSSGLGAGEVSHPSDAAEQAAEATGRSIANGPAMASAAAPATAAAGVAREVAPEEEELQMARDPGAPIAREAAPEEEELQMARDPGAPIAREAAPEEEELQMARDPSAPIAREAAPEEEEELLA